MNQTNRGTVFTRLCSVASFGVGVLPAPYRQTFLEVQEHFGLPSLALVEKDWFVVQALAAIHDVGRWAHSGIRRWDRATTRRFY